MMCTSVVIPHWQWCAHMWLYHTDNDVHTCGYTAHMDNDADTCGYTTHPQWCAHMWSYHTQAAKHTCGHTTHRQQSTCLWQQNWNKIYYSGWLWDSFTPESMFPVQTWMFEYGRKRLISLEVLIATIVHVFSHSEGPQVASPRYQILCSLLKTWRFIKNCKFYMTENVGSLSVTMPGIYLLVVISTPVNFPRLPSNPPPSHLHMF